MTELQSAITPTPEPVKTHDNENSSSCEVIINGLVEDKGTFKSAFEADNCKVKKVFNHMDETTLKVDSNRELEKPKGNMSRPRPLTVRFTSERDARKRLPTSYKLKNYHERVFISKSLNKIDQATKQKFFQKRYEMINTDRITRVEIKTKGLKFLRSGIVHSSSNCR